MRSMHDARVCGERRLIGLRGCLFVALVCVAAGTLHARPAAAAGPVIAVDTNVLAGGVQANGVYTPSDSEFWIQVAVIDAAPTGAFEFQLSFDSQIFQYLGWSEGAFLGSTGLGTACVPNISQHTVNIGCNTFSSSGVAGPSGNGTLIIIRFHPKLAAPACFLLTGVETATTDGVPIPTSSQDGCVTPSTLGTPPTATWTAVAPTATWTAVVPPAATWTPAPTATATAAATATSVSVPTSTATTAASAVAPAATPATEAPAAGGTREAASPEAGSGTPSSATSARSTPASGGGTGQTGGATGASAHGTGLSADAPAGEVPGAGSAGSSAGQGATTNAGQSGSGDGGSTVGAGDSSAEHDVLSSTKRPDGSPADVSAASSGAGGGGVAWWIVALAAIGGCVVVGMGAAGGRWWWARRA